MKQQDLTNEALSGIYRSHFELAKQGIELWRYMIHAGKEMRLPEVIKLLKRHPEPEYLEELKKIDELELERKAREQPTIA